MFKGIKCSASINKIENSSKKHQRNLSFNSISQQVHLPRSSTPVHKRNAFLDEIRYFRSGIGRHDSDFNRMVNVKRVNRGNGRGTTETFRTISARFVCISVSLPFRWPPGNISRPADHRNSQAIFAWFIFQIPTREARAIPPSSSSSSSFSSADEYYRSYGTRLDTVVRSTSFTVGISRRVFRTISLLSMIAFDRCY